MNAQNPSPIYPERPQQESVFQIPWAFLGTLFSSVLAICMPIVALLLVLIALGSCVNLLHDTWLSIAYPQVANAQAHAQIAEANAHTAATERQRASDAVWVPRIEQAKGIALTAGFLAPVAFLGLLLAYALGRGIQQMRLPPADGRPPSLRWSDDRRWFAWQLHQARLTALANQGPVPAALSYAHTYAPRIEGALPALPPAQIPNPDLRQLLELPGWCFGLGERGPVTLEGELRSVGLGGQPKTGKSVTAAFLVAQVRAKGGSVICGDPHANQEQRSLSGYLGGSGVIGPDREEIMDMVHDFHGTWQYRKSQKGRDWPLMGLVLDEWPELLNVHNGKELPSLLLDILRGGSKFGMVAFLLAQNWAAAQAGGSAIRSVIAIHLAHAMRKEELRMQTGRPAESLPADTLDLQPGHAYVFGHPEGLQRVRVPQVRPEDLRPVLGPAEGATDNRSEGSSEPPRRPQSPAEELSGREREVCRLWVVEGLTMAQIAREFYGQKGGRGYQQALREIEGILRHCPR